MQDPAPRTAQRSPDIDWSRVVAFHMDEYIGLAETAAQRFGKFRTERLFAHVHPGQFHPIEGLADPVADSRRYGRLLAEAPIDMVCLGRGENGHVAFNDPPAADFSDPLPMKVVELDEACRQQQVNYGCFATLAEVPTRALTLTISTLFSGHHLVCSVLGRLKRAAMAKTLAGPISPRCPATILRTHPDCVPHVDLESLPDPPAEAFAGARVRGDR